MSEQEFNLRKYVFKAVLDDAKGNFDKLDKMLNEAKNDEDLEKVYTYLKDTLMNINSNSEKLDVSVDGKSK